MSNDLIIKSFDTGFHLSVWLSKDLIIKSKISTIKSINTLEAWECRGRLWLLGGCRCSCDCVSTPVIRLPGRPYFCHYLSVPWGPSLHVGCYAKIWCIPNSSPSLQCKDTLLESHCVPLCAFLIRVSTLSPNWSVYPSVSSGISGDNWSPVTSQGNLTVTFSVSQVVGCFRGDSTCQSHHNERHRLTHDDRHRRGTSLGTTVQSIFGRLDDYWSVDIHPDRVQPFFTSSMFRFLQLSVSWDSNHTDSLLGPPFMSES
jgi:hypothetical protein